MPSGRALTLPLGQTPCLRRKTNMSAGNQMHDHHDHSCCSHDAPKAHAHTVKDPVCGMDVDPHTAKHRTEYQGRPYYFCSAGCKAKFEQNPEKYLAPREAEPVRPGAIYTCPMHPEIRQEGPGSCPICGVALEPLEITADAA